MIGNPISLVPRAVARSVTIFNASPVYDSSATQAKKRKDDVHVRVKRVDNVEVTMIRRYSADERVSVKPSHANRP
jgi:hypothetical protein